MPRDPLIIIAGLVALFMVILGVAGPTWIDLFGRMVRLRASPNLLTAIYIFIFAAAARRWWGRRAAFDERLADTLGLPARTLFYWHALPIAISFLLPRRLAVFLWYVGPTHSTGDYNPIAGFFRYWSAFQEGFHVSKWAALLAAALISWG